MPSSGQSHDPPNGAVNCVGRAIQRKMSANRGNAPAKIAKRQPIVVFLSPPFPASVWRLSLASECDGYPAAYAPLGSKLAQPIVAVQATAGVAYPGTRCRFV